MPTIDLNAITIFAKVAELSSFRGAAKALGIPHSTVSSKVAELEATLGVRLLNRTTRVVKPSEAGLDYLRFVGPALAALADAPRRLADLQTKPSGHLRVTAPPELGDLVLGRALSAYRERAPEVTVGVDLTGRRVNLIEEGFDVALRAGELADSTLVARRVGAPQALYLCASPGYLRRHGAPRHPRDLAGHECLVMTERKNPHRWPFREGRRRLAVEVRGHASANSFALLRDLAILGHGVARLPAFLARPALAAQALCPLLEPFAPPALAYHAVYPGSRDLSPKVRLFVDLLSEECKRLFV